MPSNGANPGIAPSAERRRQGPVELMPQTIKDIDGRPAQPWRALNTTEILLRHGNITKEMQNAAERFHYAFVLAALDPLAAADPTRVPVLAQGARYNALQGSEHARTQIVRALRVLGGPETHLGSCAWHVLGRELSLREWVIYRGWNRRPVVFATGILVGTLDLLRIHYGS